MFEVKGAASGPLAGRTIGLKDHIAVAGVPMSNGSYFLDGYTPDFDATVVTRLLDAGATITGKMNMEDFSFGGPGVAGVGDFGRPLNPHNDDTRNRRFLFGRRRGRGGARDRHRARWRPGRVDSHSGGMVRVRRPQGDAWPGSAQRHIRSRSERRLRRADDANGRGCRDGFAMHRRPRRFRSATAGRAGEVARLRRRDRQGHCRREDRTAGGRFRHSGRGERSRGCGQRAIGVLKNLGATLKPVSVPLHKMAWLAMGPIFVEGARAGYDTNFSGAFGGSFMPSSFMSAFGRAKRSHSHELPLNFKLILLAGVYAHERLSGKLYAKSYAARPPIAAQYREAFKQVDILVMPTCPITAPEYETPSDYRRRDRPHDVRRRPRDSMSASSDRTPVRSISPDTRRSAFRAARSTACRSGCSSSRRTSKRTS